jgi:hypothetical protein
MPALSLKKAKKKFDLSYSIERIVRNAKDRKGQMIYGRILKTRRRQEKVVGSCKLLFVLLSHFQPGEK